MKGIILFVTCLASVSYSSAADVTCEELPSGETVLLPYPNDCTQYYECLGGVKIQKKCTEGLWFNKASQSCDFDDSVCLDSTDDAPSVCYGNIVDVFPYPYDCTRYLECYNGILVLQTCPGGLWFSSDRKSCVYPDDSNCLHLPTSTIAPPFTAPESICWGVLPGETLLKPYPGDCNRYVECFGAQKTDMVCPPHLYFSYYRQLCDWPTETECDDTTRIPDPTTTINPNPPTPPNGDDDPRCANGNTDYWPHPECTKFIECFEGHGYEMDCPRGLYFNPNDKKCENAGAYGCGEATTASIPTPTKGDDWTPDPRCPWPTTGRYLYPYPGDCTRFFECAEGELVEEMCPAFLWFNPNLLICDYPYQSGCIWSREMEN